MTILGPDLSSFQDGLDVSALPYPFVLAKCTEGTYYVDRDYAGWRAQAEASGKDFVAYHFISGEGPAAQARNLAAHIGDKAVPVMLDWEPTGNYRPDLPQLLAVADAMIASGLRVVLAYVPRWYHQQIGSPSLAGLASRGEAGIAMVSSAYASGSAYPGDQAAGWQPYGGITPALYQYTASAPIQGQKVDMNAFRGTREQLRDVLGLSTTHTTEGADMGSISPAISQKWPELAAEFPPNGSFDLETAAIWADGGARAAALYAKQTLDAVQALAAKYQAPPLVDVDALAAALAPHLSAGASPDEVARAVVVHLGAVLTVGAPQ